MKGKELSSNKKLEVLEVDPGFMKVYPNKNSGGIIFYYQKSFIEYFGIFLFLIGILLLFIPKKYYSPLLHIY